MHWLVAMAVAGVGDEVEATRALRQMRMARAVAEPRRDAYDAATRRPVAGIEAVAGSTAKAWGVLVVDLPVEAVWMAINDEARMAGRLPVSMSTVIGGQARKAPRRVFEYMPLPIVSDRWWVVDVAHNAALYEASGGRLWEASWSDATAGASLPSGAVGEAAADGHPVDWTYGGWLLVALADGRTVVEYYSWSDPGGAIPAGASRFAGGAVRQTLTAIAALAAENVGRDRSGFVRPDGRPL
jgi:hypothetical protein